MNETIALPSLLFVDCGPWFSCEIPEDRSGEYTGVGANGSSDSNFDITDFLNLGKAFHSSEPLCKTDHVFLIRLLGKSNGVRYRKVASACPAL